MVMVVSLFGLLLGIIGVFLYRKRKKVLGSLLVFIGAALLITGIVAILNFHP
jgi:LPXTG-motif cell wall-anchored protein